jgi:primosomal protein N' (replication factor Y) (superfamily II helicase)
MFAEVIFPLPFRKSFTYSIPKEFEKIGKPGIRVVVPFGKRVLTGFLINLKNTAEIDEEIKPISDVLDEKPIFNKSDLEFYRWLSDYYMCSLGEAMKLAIPYGTEVESRKRIISHREVALELLKDNKVRSVQRKKILEILSRKEDVGLSYLQKQVGKKNIYYLVKSLEDEGALTTLHTIPNPKVRIKKVNYVKLAKPLTEIDEAIPEIERRSPKQVGLLLELISQKNNPAAGLSSLLKKTGSSKSSVDSLEKKGLVTVYEKEIERKYSGEYSEEHVEFNLTKQQNEMITEVSKFIENKKFQTFLLHGVTGSGKTQVYIELAKKVLANNKSVLILVPEISLTPQITSRFFNNFGDNVTVIHSRMSLGERYDSWRRVLDGKSKIVIGARSALFSPLRNLGLIVVDEEHDTSYKQFESIPKYNAKDSAVFLGKINNCPVLLGSATPSIESMYNAQTGKYKLLTLKERVDNAKLPTIELVNISTEAKKGTGSRQTANVFSNALLNKIEDRLNKKENVIILQNRRGFSTNIYCTDCKEIEMCQNCSVPLVYHINKNILKCHYCGFTKEVSKACVNCGSLKLKFFGTGTERVEDEIEFYFPKAKVKRIDSDSITKKSSLGKTLSEFKEGKIDILVGTQMVSKGLDFSNVTLVGVISAETTLWLPDFRADERTFQLLTQVSGRAGRSKIAGEVLIQTYNEKNFTLQKVLTNDYNDFYKHEIEIRQEMHYPPFTRICLIEAKDRDFKRAEGAIGDLYKELRKYKKKLTILSPTPAIISRLKGFYRFHILIKSLKGIDPGGAILRKVVLEAFVAYNRKSRYKDVKLIFDIDPQNLL